MHTYLTLLKVIFNCCVLGEFVGIVFLFPRFPFPPNPPQTAVTLFFSPFFRMLHAVLRDLLLCFMPLPIQ